MPSLEGNILTVGARDSKLSRAQVHEVLESLQKFHSQISFSPIWIKTTGDIDLVTSLRHLDKTDFFTREIDDLLLSRACRLGIHSAKDLPEPLPYGLEIVALTEGVDPSDCLVLALGMNLSTLPPGARIGTSSLRREQTILALRADLRCVDIRGNIEKRLDLLQQGKVDGLVVAEAALIRLGLTHLNRIKLPGQTAPLQGKLAVIARTADEEMRTLFACLDTRQFAI